MIGIRFGDLVKLWEETDFFWRQLVPEGEDLTWNLWAFSVRRKCQADIPSLKVRVCCSLKNQWNVPKGEGSKSQRHFYWDIAISLMFITVLHIAHRIALIENRILLPAYRSYNAVESERPNKMMVTIFCVRTRTSVVVLNNFLCPRYSYSLTWCGCSTYCTDTEGGRTGCDGEQERKQNNEISLRGAICCFSLFAAFRELYLFSTLLLE